MNSKTNKFTAISLVAISAALLCLPLAIKIPEGETNAWIEFIGAFHPVLLHLPIGFLLLIVSLEFLGLFSKSKAKTPMQAALLLNALASVSAALLGFVLYLTGSWDSETIENHLWGGLIYAVCAIWLPYVYYLTAARSKAPYMAVLLGSALVMALAAHEGGKLTHGDPLDKLPWKQKASEQVSDPVFYTGVIVPILEEKCYSCHGEKKGKSGLRMHDMALFLEGGEEHIALEPGNIEESFFISTLHLHIDDDYHMPPEGKPQITEEEAALLEFWVASGAAIDKKLSELNLTPEITAILGAVTAANKHSEESHKEPAGRSAKLEASVISAKKELGSSLNWLSTDSTELEFSAVNIRKHWNDEHIQTLQPVASSISTLNLNGTTVSDSISELLSNTKQLKDLRLAETSVSNAILNSIPDSVEVLNLHSTNIDDAGLDQLKDKENLKRVYLWNSKVTEEGRKKLANLLPDLEIL